MLKKCIISLVVLSCFLYSCGPEKISVGVKRPAEINLSKFKKIAVGEIQGQYGNDISDLLTESLFTSGQYEVLDRANLKTILTEQGLGASGIIDENSSLKIGKVLGSSAMIFGRVSKADFNDSKVTQSQCVDGNGVQFITYTRYGVVTMIVNYKVTDLTTGKIVATKNITKEITGNIQGERNTQPAHIDPSNLFDEAKKKAVSDFMKMIAVYTEYVSVCVETNSKVPSMVSGVNKVKLSQWTDAINDFQKALEEIKANPKLSTDIKENAKVLYNIGICYSYSGDYEKAFKFLTEAYSKNPKDYYEVELSRCRKYKEEKKKLEEQGVNARAPYQRYMIVFKLLT